MKIGLKNLEKEKITIINELYKLMLIKKKIRLIYNKKGKIINTKSFIINENKEKN
jgi:hypothetical protein